MRDEVEKILRATGTTAVLVTHDQEEAFVFAAEGVVTEIGVFANPNGRPAGARVSVMIRPDDATFAPDPAGDAVIVRRYFRGSENLYCLGLPSGHRVHSLQPSSVAYSNGLRVRAQAHVLHVVTFPA